MRIAIIGAGIVGVTTAYELAAQGHEVTVFDRRGSVAEECSFANAGVVAPGYVAPWAAPGMTWKVLRHMFDRDTTVATLPIGYADGVPRRLYAVGGTVLVGGHHRPIVGVVTMDQLMIDCGDAVVQPGDHAVLLGQQGDQRITADDWAVALDTIAYEVVCGLSVRLERRVI